MAVPYPEQARFDAAMARLRKKMPDDESYESIKVGFYARWERPPMENLEKVLRRGVSLDEARRILFNPEADDLADYVTAFTKRPPGCPPEHPLSKVQPVLLGIFYMSFCDQQRLMRPFVLAGGLRALVGLLSEENVYVASQALESFYTLTGLFDWHEDDDAAMLRGMADLAHTDVRFVATIASLRVNRFPGCSLRALTILAFWLSLMRHRFCKKRVLRLGPDVLELLRTWSEPREGEFEPRAEEEAGLAAKLHADFSRFPLEQGADRGSSPAAEGLAGIAHAAGAPLGAIAKPTVDWRSDALDDLD